ncbi:hypothetical protein [uncultured Flavobacterium sp.]|uniref:hypothetical protein n=1 Tax=uncultured Flavobacterium sp. TaxID=165435 RepID=UPI00263A28BF|nr:hypothetical protein [uncultured Flavobacterium sp.]
MLTFFMWAIGVSSNTTITEKFKSQIEFQKKNNDSNYSHFQTVEVEESEFIIIESEPEFEVESNWFLNHPKNINFKSTELKEKSNSYFTSLFSSKETIPLYDLYCNWKFHLS